MAVIAVGAAILVWSIAVSAEAQEAASPLAAADAAMRAGRFADAAQAYEAWLEKHPDAREVLFALGVCNIQLGRPVRAAELLRRYVRLAPASADGHAALGIALLDGAATSEASKALEKAISLNPGQQNAIEALARIHLVEGEPARAVEMLRPLAADGGEAAEREPFRTLLAEALIRAGDPAAAVQLLEGQLARPRPSIPTFVLAGWAHIKSGDLRRAAAICEQGMRLHPDSEIESVYLSLPGPVLAERTAARLAALQTPPDVDELIALGRVLTDVDPGRKTRAGEIAQRLLSEAVAMAPQHPSARYNYGRALGRTDIAGALAQWEKALALGPADELRLQIYTQIGRAKDSLSDVPGAEEAFRAALDINRRLPRRVPEAAIEYVRFLQVHSQSSRAEAVLEEVLAWNPWSPEARAERARFLADRRQWTEVIVEGEFVLRNARDDRALLRLAHLLLARAYYRLDQPAKAQVHRAWLESH